MAGPQLVATNRTVSYTDIIEMIVNNKSKEDVLLAAEKLGISESALSAVSAVYDLLNPLSVRRKEQNNAIMNANIKMAAEELNKQFQAILAHNLQLQQLAIEVLKELEASNNASKFVPDSDEPAPKINKEEEKSLLKRLEEQNASISQLQDEIKDTDKKIEEKQQKVIEILTQDQQQHIKQINTAHIALQKSVQDEIDKISLDDPDRINKIATLEEKLSTTYRQNDNVGVKLFKDYNNIIEQYNALLIDCQQQIALLNSPEAIKASNGHSLILLATKLILLEQYADVQLKALKERADEIKNVYSKIYGNPSELEILQLSYNKAVSRYKTLEKEVADEEEENRKFNRPASPELLAKYNKLAEMDIELTEMAKKISYYKNFFGAYDKKGKFGLDKNAIDKMVADADTILNNLNSNDLNLKSIHEHVQSKDHPAKEINDLYNLKAKLIGLFKEAVKQQSEIVLSLSTISTLKPEQQQQQQQQQTATKTETTKTNEQQQKEREEEHRRPGMGLTPSSGSNN